jgi:hypothetical protein
MQLEPADVSLAQTSMTQLLEESSMPSNPYPDESMRMAPADPLEQTEQMEDIPLKRPPAPAAAVPVPVPMVEKPVAIEIPELPPEETHAVKRSIVKLSDFIQWFVAVLEVALALRFVLKLIGADPNNAFALLLYGSTNIVLFPFSNIITTVSRFEGSTLIAMIVYALILWAIKRFLSILITDPDEEMAS